MANAHFYFKVIALDADGLERRIGSLGDLAKVAQSHVEKFNDEMAKETVKEINRILKVEFKSKEAPNAESKKQDALPSADQPDPKPAAAATKKAGKKKKG